MRATIDLLRDHPQKRGMLASVIEACCFNIWFTAVSGSFLTGFAIYLGAGGFTLGVLAGLPAFSTMLQVFCAPFLVGLVRRRRFLAIGCAVQRFTTALSGLIALVLMPSPVALSVFVGLQLFAWAAVAPPVVVWNGYMSDLVPIEMRGQYFARRSAWAGGVAMVAVMLYGWLLERFPGAPGFQLLYLFCLTGAALNLAAWTLHPELPPGETRRAGSFWDSVRVPLLRRGPHRPATLFFAAWAGAQGIAVPFYPVVLVQKMGISYEAIAVLMTLQTLTAILTAGFWGRLQDRIGQPRVIGIVAGLLATVPLLFLGARWGGLPVLVVAHMLQGTALNAMTVANQTLNMRLAPREDRSSYFAFFGVAAGLMGFFTPMLMGPLTGRFMDGLLIASAAASAGLCLVWRSRLAPLVAEA